MHTARIAGVRVPGASFDQLSAARRMSLIRCSACASGDGRRGDSDMLGRETGLSVKGKACRTRSPWPPSHSHRVRPPVPFLAPRIASHVVSVLLPEARVVLLEKL